MSKRPHQGYTLLQMLKASKPNEVVSRADIAKKLGVNEGSVAIYFHGLKKFFGVDFEVVKEGRAVVGYILISRDAEMSPSGRREASAAKPKTKKVSKTSKVTVTKTKTTQVKTKSKNAPVEIEDLDVEEITDTELSDIKSQLGLA